MAKKWQCSSCVEFVCVWLQRLSVVIIFVATLCFSLGWQFNQFVLLLQAFALFGTWILDMVPPRKVRGNSEQKKNIVNC